MIHYVDINRYRYKVCMMCFLNRVDTFKDGSSGADILFNGKMEWLRNEMISGKKWKNVIYNTTPDKLCDCCPYTLEHTISDSLSENMIEKVNLKIIDLIDEHGVEMKKELIDI